MKIYDAFPFWAELDLLELRMNILDPYVDYFIIQECDTTFQGNPKQLNFLNNKDRFKKFEHKIIYSVFNDIMGNKWNNWDRDREHKNQISNVFKSLKLNDDDIVLLSDVDEIPNFQKFPLDSFYKSDKLFVCRGNCYFYYLNMLFEKNWLGTKICNYGYYKNYSFDDFKNFQSTYHKTHKDEVIFLDDMGWHFSFLGGVDNIRDKIKSWSHAELNNDFILSNVESNVKQCKDIFYRPNFNPTIVPIDNTYPTYLLNNLDTYSSFILKE